MTDIPIGEQERREAEAAADVVSSYLHPGYSAEEYVQPEEQGDEGVSPSEISQSGQESSLKLLGGDIHRDLYKIYAKPHLPRRAATISDLDSLPTDPVRSGDELTATEQRAPGGFRRQYLLQRNSNSNSATTPMTRSFIDFLDVYGNFAGEDLAESDDMSDADSADGEEPRRANRSSETTPLLRRRSQRRRPIKAGDAGMTRSFFTLLKAFIGTGIMFLPKAFNNGGILFSSITLVTISLATTLCFYLLLQCRKKFGGGYGDMGEAVGGPILRSLILTSITISQIGFVCSSLIFTAENLMSFLRAVKTGSVPLSTNSIIALQLVVLIPLSLIRNMSKLGAPALLADVFIFFGLTYIYYYDISAIATLGVNKSVELFNPRHYTLTVGSSIFTFEGIGLILPIQSSMKEPEKFNRLLYVVMIIITVIFTAVGALSYATFGGDTRTEVISNFPQTSKLVNTVQFLYSIAVLVGAPVQLFPAVRIVEAKIFGHRSGRQSAATKWKKNAFRTFVVVLCGVIAALGANDLDKFVALIGSFACVPLVYIYPAFLHYKAIAKSRHVVAGDVLLMVVGFVAMVYTTCITVVRWIEE